MIIAQIERDLLKIWISIKKALPLFLIVLVVISPLLFMLEKNTQPPVAEPEDVSVSIGIEQKLESELSLWNYDFADISPVWFEHKEDILRALSDKDISYALTSSDSGALQLFVGKSTLVKDVLADGIVTFLMTGTDLPVAIESYESDAHKHSNSPKFAWAGVVALIVFISIVSSFLVWEERAMGYLEELIASPASHLSIMISKLLAVLIAVGGAITALIVVVLLFTVGMAFFGDSGSFVSQSAAEASGSSDSPLSISTVAYILSVVAGVSSVAAILVIIQLTIRDRMIISLVTLTFNVPLFFLPLLVPVQAFTDASWAWMLPVINIYGDLSYAMLQGDPSYSFLPGMLVNLTTLCAVILIGAVSVGRIKDWPSR